MIWLATAAKLRAGGQTALDEGAMGALVDALWTRG
jgi:hypothetical protein